MNFQIFKLDLEKAEEPEIKLPTSIGSSKKQELQKNIYFCFIDYVDHNKLWEILKEMGIPDHLTCLLRNLYADQVVWYSHLFKNFPQFVVIHIVNGFSVPLEAWLNPFS